MAERPAVNASPLIILAHAGHLDLLQLVAPEFVVPRPVADEIHRRGSGDPTAKALATIEWLQVVSFSQVPPEILSWDLGPGEASVLGWCYEHTGAEAIIDDLPARRCARAFGIPVRGTLGLVLLGKRRGRFSSGRWLVEQNR